ncbi:SDR family NAD(P)-dependent oxidoreductase [Kineococcus rhizosphaerae]|uniref:NAD(P)-dependent dehydrogenase (Short-subunit alcohol dehydrogenase family) n=1 Tax=Kineococcus rhizosphaerae TaxID=559628 RepID=A0A2T0R6R3_9ACTN|nr:glucose 1-dehydrogenase [Kineococcus rhizosphaerae]PRY16865.1 NAD(P)-dependent dehydrogenase (short-subunit alcohol dehydrogenase family) [Kineococcus rhizosphaerae]
MTPRSIPESFDLTGRRALVTGATQGLGTDVVRTLAAAGCDLVLSARTHEALQALAAAVRGDHGVRVEVVAADLSDAADTESLASRALAAFDGLDVLVNNAGVSFPQRVVDVDAGTWDRTLAVNLRAPALLGSRVGRAMAAAGRGSIVNVSSVAGSLALAEHFAYSSSKAALVMATKVLALELGPSGVRANSVSPTVVMTEMGQRVWGEQAKAAPMLVRIPLGRFAQPGDVSGAVLFLASDASAMVNGVDLTVDGGFSAA